MGPTIVKMEANWIRWLIHMNWFNVSFGTTEKRDNWRSSVVKGNNAQKRCSAKIDFHL